MSLCIFNRITACNKSFYISFEYLYHKDKDLYFWIMTQIQEFYIYVRQKDKPKVILTDKNDVFITGFAEVISTSHHILYILYMNKNFMACITEFFKNSDQIKAQMDL